MTKNYEEIYAQKLEHLKAKTVGTSINETLELKNISNRKLDEIRNKMSQVVPGKTTIWDDFNFRTGKILGILRFISQNPQHRQQLLEVTGLTQDYVDIYFNVCGNLPYLNTTNNTLNLGRPMDVEATKEFISVVAAKFGIVIEEIDLSDISQERWDRLYQAALEKITETVKHNKEHGESIPEQGYDE